MNRKKKFLDFVRNKSNIKKILVLRNGLIGDTVFITATLTRLNYTFPDALIDVIVGKNCVSLLKYFPGLRRIIPFNYNFHFFSIIKQIFFFAALIIERYDLLVILETNPHYTLMGKLVFAKKVAAFSSSFKFLTDYNVQWPSKRAIFAETEIVASWTEISNQDKPVLYNSEDEIHEVRQLLENNGITINDKIITIYPFSSKQNSEFRWDLNGYAQVADFLISKHGYKVIFNGIERDRLDFEKIASFMSAKPVILAGVTTIRNMVALISLSSVVIGVDSGAVHVASAVGVPVVCLMGYSDPQDSGPYNPEIPIAIVI